MIAKFIVVGRARSSVNSQTAGLEIGDDRKQTNIRVH